jgi:hypothetical protein
MKIVESQGWKIAPPPLTVCSSDAATKICCLPFLFSLDVRMILSVIRVLSIFSPRPH